MNNNQNVSNTSSISTATLLGVLFVGLKLTGYINWPWVWVLSPFWIPIVILLGVLLVLAVAVSILNFTKQNDARR